MPEAGAGGIPLPSSRVFSYRKRTEAEIDNLLVVAPQIFRLSTVSATNFFLAHERIGTWGTGPPQDFPGIDLKTNDMFVLVVFPDNSPIWVKEAKTKEIIVFVVGTFL